MCGCLNSLTSPKVSQKRGAFSLWQSLIHRKRFIQQDIKPCSSKLTRKFKIKDSKHPRK
eukprot:c5958_g1_i1 orf=33-209(+)